jgi:hypothetical protein
MTYTKKEMETCVLLTEHLLGYSWDIFFFDLIN